MNKEILGVLLVLLCLGGLFASCVKDKTSAATLDCSHNYVYESADSFSIKPIIQLACSYQGCHERGASIGNFTDYNVLKSYVDNQKFFKRVIDNKDMPPSNATLGPKSLTTEEIAQLQCWLDQGAQR